MPEETAAAASPFHATLTRLLAEKPSRNRDNVSRTESYLELYALARDHGHELPWLLMAHLVSRNAGYLMTDLGAARADPARVFTTEALGDMLLMLERANFLIFDDAWHHVLHHLLGRTHALDARTPRFMRAAWQRHEEAARHGVPKELERQLVLDLVTNEQNLIEHRAVHHARFERAAALITFFESIGRDGAIVLPLTDAEIKVGRFGDLARRIDTGRRIFDEVLAAEGHRDAILAWAKQHPHTGSRRVYTKPRHALTLREAWPVARVEELWLGIHSAPEADPSWP